MGLLNVRRFLISDDVHTPKSSCYRCRSATICSLLSLSRPFATGGTKGVTTTRQGATKLQGTAGLTEN